MAKQPYELSLWEDYVVPGNDTVSEHFSERLKAVIGSSTMDSPFKAYDITLKETVSGELTLTFSMVYQYYDNEKKELRDNPFFYLLTNEAKIKLRNGFSYFDDVENNRMLDPEQKLAYLEEEDTEERWKDFYIKNIEKNSSTHIATITAKESFVNELGKNGWSLVLNTELENNYGTIEQLASFALEETDWQVAPESYSPVETIEESLFRAPVTISFKAKNIITEEEIILPVGSNIYIFYSSADYNEETERWVPSTDEVQFLYKASGFTLDDIDDNNVILDDEFIYNFIVDRSVLDGKIGDLVLTGSTIGGVAFKGEKVKKNQLTVYVNSADVYARKYVVNNAEAGAPVGKEVYGYDQVDYVTSSTVRNLITNSSSFISDTAWLNENPTATIDDIPEVMLFPRPGTNQIWDDAIFKPVNYLALNFSKANNLFTNEGPLNSHLTLVKDKKYVVRFKGRWIRDNAITEDTTNILIPDSTTQLKFDLVDVLNVPRTNTVVTDLISSDYVTDSTNIKKYGFLKDDTIETRAERCHVPDGITHLDEQGFGYVFLTATSNTDPTEYNENIYFRIGCTQIVNGFNYCIEDIQLFPYEVDANNQIIFPLDVPESVIKTTTRYFYNVGKTNIYLSGEDSYYTPLYEAGFKSVRSIEVKESNYFNIIQSLAELFEVWVRFRVKHRKNGQVLLVDGQPVKEVIFSKYAPNGEEINSVGFRYGVNLRGIQRKVDSNSISTKVIVKNNNQDYAIDGMASISRAVSNPSGENEIYDFNYYVSQGILPYTQVLNDLYGTSSSDLRYLPRLKKLNKEYDEKSKLVLSFYSAVDDLLSDKQIYDAAVSSVQLEITDVSAELSVLSTNDSLYNAKNITLAQLRARLSNYQNLQLQTNNLISYYYSKIDEYELGTETARGLEQILAEKKLLKLQFYKKYYRFIQEGTWTDDSYIDDELYYLDALKIASISAYPQVSYTIDVFEVENIDEYAGYKFKVGDRTWVEDPEFFGYTFKTIEGESGLKTPRKVEVIVSERTFNFDNPTKSTLTVKNYKNQFEELFQKITATTQALQYQNGAYNRAAGVISPSGEIEVSTLEKSFANNSLILSSSHNQTVTWDTGLGIEVTNNENTNEKVRIVGGGIFLTSDGGKSWANGISGAGINTKYLIAGQIDANKINIVNAGIPRFRWDESGITAYRMDIGAGTTTYNVSRFVRFNQYGIYCSDPNEPGYEDVDQAIKEANDAMQASQQRDLTYAEILAIIKEKATFSLTSEGLALNTNGDLAFQNNSLTLTALSGLEIFNNSVFNQEFLDTYSYVTDPKGQLYTAGSKIPIVSIGMFKNTANDTGVYGIRMRNSQGKIVLSTDTDGQFWVNEQLFVGGDFQYAATENEVYSTGLSGQSINEDEYFNYIEQKRYELGLSNGIPEATRDQYLKQNSVRIWAGGTVDNIVSSTFFVLENGLLYASNAYIDGFITARGGKFSGSLTVGEDETNGIDGTAFSDHVFWAGRTTHLNENDETIVDYTFRVDSNGRLYATDASITGEINAYSGNITNLSIGENSGIGIDRYSGIDNIILWANASDHADKTTSSFYVTKDGELYTSKIYLKDSILIGAVDGNDDSIIDYYKAGINEETSQTVLWAGADSNNYLNSNFTVSYDGYVVAKSLDLGGGELKGSSALLTGNLYLASNRNSDGLILDGNKGISTTTFNPSGNIGWAIDSSGDAYFNNIIARGELKTATFTYESKNMMGGDLLISPAYFFDSVGQVSTDSFNYYVTFSVTADVFARDFWDEIDNSSPQILFNCILSNETEYSGLYGTVERFGENTLRVTIPLEKNSDRDFSSWRGVNSVLSGSSLALQNGCGINLTAGDTNGPAIIITDIVDKSRVITQIGRLGRDSEGVGVVDQYFGELEGYGLYAQNAYITGKLFLPNAGITDETVEYAGSNKIGSGFGQNVRMWAGVDPSNKQTAPFVVTQDGTLYASKGIFSGQVIATDSTFSGWLNTAGILIDPEENQDEIKQIFYVAYNNDNRTKEGFPLIEDRIIQIDKNGLAIWEGGLSVFSDWAAGWRIEENGNSIKTSELEGFYGPTLVNGIEEYEEIYPYIKAIDSQYHRLYASEFHSNHFKEGSSNSIKITNGILQFSSYYNSGESSFLELESEAFSTSNSWNFELQNNNLKVYPLESANEEGYLQFKNKNIDDGEIEIELQGLLEIKEEISFLKRTDTSKPKINFPEAIIQHYNNADGYDWDNGLDFMI